MDIKRLTLVGAVALGVIGCFGWRPSLGGGRHEATRNEPGKKDAAGAQATAQGDEEAADAPPPGGWDRAVEMLLENCFHSGPGGTGKYEGPSDLMLDALDIGGKLTELERVAWLKCVGSFDGSEGVVVDYLRFDHQKALKEARARVKDPEKRKRVEGALGVTNEESKRVRSKASQPKIKEAAEIYDRWRAEVYEPNKATLEVAFGLIARALGPDRDKAKGCSAESRPLFAKVVKAKLQKTLAETNNAILDDPVASVVLQADALCNALDDPLLGAGEVVLATYRPTFFGPRRAVHLAQRVKDDWRKPDFSKHPNMSKLAPYHRDGYPEKPDVNTYELKTVTPKGDELELVSTSDKWNEPTYNCFKTNRIERITADGRLEREEICNQSGTEQMKREFAPMLVQKDHAALVAPKRFVALALEGPWIDHARHLSTGDNSMPKLDPIHARPVVVFANAKAFQAGGPFTYYYGVSLQ